MNSFYFPHDYSTRLDSKIKAMIRSHGMQGYGIYWSLIEDLYINANALRLDCDCIAYDLRCDSETVESIIYEYDLFTVTDGVLSSEGIKRRVSEIKEKSAKARKSALYRWEKSDGDANAMRTQCERNAIKEIKENKVKKEKNYIDIDPYKKVKLQQAEYDALIARFGERKAKEFIERLSLYIGSRGDKYKSHYLTILNWDKMDRAKVAESSSSTGYGNIKRIDQ